ncbi:MAG: hypothetical protein KBC19_04185 [Candidatus Moranbacteria bacterium]|nr:hypothetical protein [Candidatus Moranbacteria bacterium]
MKINLLGPQPEKHAVFSVHEGKPYGMPDGHRIDVVSLDDDGTLRPRRADSFTDHCNDVEVWLCWLPLRGWMGYYLFSCQENGAGPSEEDAKGPYLFLDIAPPTSKEWCTATQANTLVVRSPQEF